MEPTYGTLRPQMMNISDCTRGQVEQVLRLPGITAGTVATGAISMKPGAAFPEEQAAAETVLWVLQGVGICEVRDAMGNRVPVRLRRGAHFAVPQGAYYRLENSGRALLIMLRAAAGA